jgi:membrane-bound metal-dependent hydrolase YbcI (DUF457 family)
MHGATHLTWGVCAGAVAGGQLGRDWTDMAVGAVVGGVAALVPDWLQINVPGASAQIRGTFGHRGFSHWLWTPLALAFLGRAVVPVGLVAAFLAGWVSHILLDALANGAPAFWPFGRLTLAHVKTGGQLDKLIGGAGLVFVGLYVWVRLI